MVTHTGMFCRLRTSESPKPAKHSCLLGADTSDHKRTDQSMMHMHFLTII